MGLFDNFSPNLPLLKGSLGLLAAGERGDSTGLALGQGLLGYAQTRADIKAADALKADKALERQINQARLAQLNAQTNKLINPNRGDRKTAQGADGFHYFVDTGERVFPSVQSVTDPTTLQTNLTAAGLVPGTKEYQDKLLQIMTMPKTQINNNLGTNAPRLPEGTRWKTPENPAASNYEVVALKGSTTDKSIKTFTDAQSKASSFATRMVEAEKTLDQVLESGHDPTNIRDAISGNLGAVGNFLKSDEGQQFSQAQEDWVRAKLRKESGAVIGVEEMEKEITTYFPQPGDGADVIKQKRRARMIATNNLIQESQGAFSGDPFDIDGDSDSDDDIDRLLEIYGN